MTSIVALGDSLAFGVGDAHGDAFGSWAGRLARVLGAPEPVRFAWPGARLTDLMSVQLGAAIARQPDIALVSIGGNDAIWHGFNSTRFQESLHGALEVLERSAGTVVLLNVPDITLRGPVPAFLGDHVRARLRQVNRAIDMAAFGTRALIIDRWGDPSCYERDHLAPDRVHPSALGYQRLAERTAWALGYPAEAAPAAMETSTARPPLWMLTSGLPWAVKRSPRIAMGIAALLRSERGS